MHHLALFDFDGTVTKKDSLIAFLKFYGGNLKFYVIFLLFGPVILYYMLVKKEGWRAKQALISWYLKGKPENEVITKGKIFGDLIIPRLILKKAIEKIRQHQKEGHRVIIVSASLDIWLKDWALKNNLELISTGLEFKNGVATGRFSTPNCNGEEKVTRIYSILDPKQYDVIHAYGNSKGDLAMLSLAHHSYMKHFS